MGWIYLFKRQHDKAIKEGERAIEINPNGAEAHAHFGYILYMSGKTELAIKLIKRAFRLNPIPPSHFYNILGGAYLCNGQYEKAIEVAKKVLRSNPDQIDIYILLTASYGALNHTEEAGKAAEEVLRVDPNFSIEYYRMVLPFKHQETLDKHIEALRKAGLQE